jgi:hypothetical protein
VSKLLYGVQCARAVAVTDDIVLLPFSEVPQSTIRDWIVTEHERANEFSLVHGFTAGPSAALYRAGTVEPIFVDIPGGSPEFAPEYMVQRYG